MSPPHFPNELVTLIFEHLYRSLCVHPSQEFLDLPIADKFIFSRFSLVSKTWHALSLPFLVRHCDGHRLEEYTEFVQRYDLARSVESIHFNLKIPEWECYEDLVDDLVTERHVDNYDGFDSGGSEEEYELRELRAECERDALEQIRKTHEKAITLEKSQWESIIEMCMPYVQKVEFGRRNRKKLETDWSDENYLEIRDKLDYGEGPGWDLVEFIDELNGPEATQLRINLVTDATLDMFSPHLDGAFPRVVDLTLAFYSTLASICTTSRYDWTNLERLRILNIDCTPDEFKESIIPSFLAPSADTLTHLHLSVHPRADLTRGSRVASYLSTLEFPCLETLDLDIPRLSCAEPDFFDRFPYIETASIPLSGSLSLHNLFKLPSSLSHLALSRLNGESLDVLVDFLSLTDTSHLCRLQIQGREPDNGVQPLDFRPNPDPSNEPDTDRVENLVKICEEKGIELIYGNVTIEDESETDRTESEEEEDEEWDFDAEEGEEFEGLWSHETRRDRDLDEAFANCRKWFRSDEALSQAREAIAPFLL